MSVSGYNSLKGFQVIPLYKVLPGTEKGFLCRQAKEPFMVLVRPFNSKSAQGDVKACFFVHAM